AGHSLELVFNGDLFDFDAPWVRNGESSFEEFPVNDQGCAEHVRRILADHPDFFLAIARVLAQGHKVLFLSGNHDIELYFAGVRRAIIEALAQHLAALGANGTNIDRHELERRVRFRSWFHITEDRIYLEHGSQYDHLNGVRYATIPLTPERDR